MRLIFTLALTSLFAACAPPKLTSADIIDEGPVIKPAGKKTTEVADATPPAPVVRVNRGGMKLPPVTDTLPDKKEFQATAPVQATADRGTSVVVPAPKPANANE